MSRAQKDSLKKEKELSILVIKGELDTPAERTTGSRRPFEPEPDNTGGGKKVKKISRNTKEQFFSIKILAEIIVSVALAATLSLISHSFFSLAQGGSINIGMLPILLLSLRRGSKIGIFAGAVFGVVDLAIEPFVVHPIQLILDYPLAFAALGVAGFFQKRPVIGVVISITGRFISHFVSGVVYFSEYAGQIHPIIYSAIYNATYIIPSMVICTIIIGILQKSKILNIYI